jgi:hypothetical protein
MKSGVRLKIATKASSVLMCMDDSYLKINEVSHFFQGNINKVTSTPCPADRSAVRIATGHIFRLGLAPLQ